jgi:predicted transcriptional regulator
MGTGHEEPATDSELSNDDLYEVLADKRRRYAIHYLKQCREPVAVRELAEQVAAWENAKSVDALGSQERKRVYIALYQSHLPSLDEAGLVNYDEDASTVELADVFDDLKIYLEIVPEADIPWNVYYIGLAGANLLLIALAWFGVQPFRLIPEIGFALIVLVSFAASAFAQTYSNRRMQIGDEGPPPDLQGEMEE